MGDQGLPGLRLSSRPLPPESLAIGALITALVALGQISTSIYTPSLPSLRTALNASLQQANLSLALFLLGFAPAQLIIGSLSDRYGRRPVLVIGLVAYITASAACALAPTIEALIAGRFVQGLAACTGPVLSRAIVRDIYGIERSATALAYIGAALALSPAIAPIIGGYLQVWFGWRSAFVFLVCVGVVLLLAVAWLLPETTQPVLRRPRVSLAGALADHLRVLGGRGFLANAIAVGSVFAGLMAYTVGGPFVFIELFGLTPTAFGLLAVFTVAGYFVGSLTAARLSRHLPPSRLMPLGLSLCLAGGAVAALLVIAARPSIVAIVAPMSVFCAGFGIVFAAGIAEALAPFPHLAGTASAWIGFLQMVIAALSTTLLGAFEMTSALPMVLGVLGTAALGAASYGLIGWTARTARENREAQDQGDR
jgi:DHA1 family bicyclomycin/chloramphenicol resistance-like MFS transporter